MRRPDLAKYFAHIEDVVGEFAYLKDEPLQHHQVDDYDILMAQMAFRRMIEAGMHGLERISYEKGRKEELDLRR